MFYDRCIKFPAAADDDSVWSSAVIRVVSLLLRSRFLRVCRVGISFVVASAGPTRNSRGTSREESRKVGS